MTSDARRSFKSCPSLVAAVALANACLSWHGLSASAGSLGKAFPTAEGYGRYAQGGRGGALYIVNTLTDESKGGLVSGKTDVYQGSLRYACEANGPRTVVFGVSGIIALTKQLRITHPHITIAGQSAPGDGICIRAVKAFRDRMVFLEADHAIVRHIRFRMGNYGSGGTNPNENMKILGSHVILDHCSFSWCGGDLLGTWGTKDNERITLQWCIFSESFPSECKGMIAGYGTDKVTYYKNLWAHNNYRNAVLGLPSASYHGPPKPHYHAFVNNVVYNWGDGGTSLSPWKLKPGPYEKVRLFANVIGNFYKEGPNGKGGPEPYDEICIMNSDPKVTPWHCRVYAQNNLSQHRPTEDLDDWLNVGMWNGRVHAPRDYQETSPSFPEDLPPISSPSQAYDDVLGLTPGVQGAGVTKPKLDVIDARIRQESASGDKDFDGTEGRFREDLADTPEGAYPSYKGSRTRDHDIDNDGMADTWELMTYGSAKSQDHKTVDLRYQGGGYTCLERFLHHQAGDIIAREAD